ncbi:MAG: hypothetical protein HYZ53_03370 [Planctomycetes bacterium]|nr:hypothetical protein [Planctomycetota bacterium]
MLDKAAMTTVVASVVSAIVGGVIGGCLTPILRGKATLDELEVRKLTVQSVEFNDLVSRDLKGAVTCQIKDGSVLAAKAVIATNVKGNLVIASSFLAASNPTVLDVNQTHVFAELGANEAGGAALTLRNKEGGFLIGQKQAKEGQSLVLAYDAKGEPRMFVQDLRRGAEGIVHLLPASAGAPAAGGTVPRPPVVTPSQTDAPPVDGK